MQVRQSDITKRKAIFLQWVEGQASYLAPWWPGRSGSACWANVRSSGQHQRRLPENHTWDTPVLGSLNKREREKKKNHFLQVHIQKKTLYHSKVWYIISKLTANHVEASLLLQTVLLKNCCETCRWEDHHYQKIWSQSSGTVHSFIHSCSPLTWPYAVWMPSGNLI